MKYITFPDCAPSFAEKIIINKLQHERIFFEREVSFEGLVNPATKAPLRYDFYIPAFNTIIEYDGIESHSADDVKERDAIKNEFAQANRIRLFRISGINNIDAFFNSNSWKRMIKKVVIHKKKVTTKKLTTWQKNHQPKEEQKPFTPLNYSQEYIKKKIADQKEKMTSIPTIPKVRIADISIDPNDKTMYSDNRKKKGFSIDFKRGSTYGTGR